MVLENINQKVLDFAAEAEIDLKDIYQNLDEICLYNSNAVP